MFLETYLNHIRILEQLRRRLEQLQPSGRKSPAPVTLCTATCAAAHQQHQKAIVGVISGVFTGNAQGIQGRKLADVWVEGLVAGSLRREGFQFAVLDSVP